jgi:hypothetical protein
MTDDTRKQLVDWAMMDFNDLVDLIEIAKSFDDLANMKTTLVKYGVAEDLIDKAADFAQIKLLRGA